MNRLLYYNKIVKIYIIIFLTILFVVFVDRPACSNAGKPCGGSTAPIRAQAQRERSR